MKKIIDYIHDITNGLVTITRRQAEFIVDLAHEADNAETPTNFYVQKFKADGQTKGWIEVRRLICTKESIDNCLSNSTAFDEGQHYRYDIFINGKNWYTRYSNNANFFD